MKRYSVNQVRMHLAEALDSAERGEAVVIERRGVRFKLESTKPSPRPRCAPTLRILDPAIDAGDWTWKSGPDGLAFVAGKTSMKPGAKGGTRR
ncbi:MAG: hypothetical protein JWM82_3059 [Myxococcales bacterium]|jgi:hypothetical protein|nr:hypothetical protein [Myxococcales bacterium]